jgi:hypothetical protein
MKRVSDEEERDERTNKYTDLIPKWYHELCAYKNGARGTEWRPAFEDDAWGWDQPVYQDDTYDRPRKTDNRQSILADLINDELFGFIAELLAKRPNISICDPCGWYGESFTPLQWALRCGATFFEDYMIGIFWSEGLSISHISSAIRSSGCEHYDEYKEAIEECVAREDAIMAMVWCCAQLGGNTQWPDISDVIAARMRRDCPVDLVVHSYENLVYADRKHVSHGPPRSDTKN